MPLNINEIPLDPNDLLQRVQRVDPNLLQRVVAEAQRDQLVNIFNQQEEQSQDVPQSPEQRKPLTDTPIADAAKAQSEQDDA